MHVRLLCESALSNSKYRSSFQFSVITIILKFVDGFLIEFGRQGRPDGNTVYSRLHFESSYSKQVLSRLGVFRRTSTWLTLSIFGTLLKTSRHRAVRAPATPATTVSATEHLEQKATSTRRWTIWTMGSAVWTQYRNDLQTAWHTELLRQFRALRNFASGRALYRTWLYRVAVSADHLE